MICVKVTLKHIQIRVTMEKYIPQQETRGVRI
jgi:hypothetical protein